MLNNKTYWSIVIVFALLAVTVHAGNFTLNFTDSINGTYISNATVNITYSFYQAAVNQSTQEGGRAGTLRISSNYVGFIYKTIYLPENFISLQEGIKTYTNVPTNYSVVPPYDNFTIVYYTSYGSPTTGNGSQVYYPISSPTYLLNNASNNPLGSIVASSCGDNSSSSAYAAVDNSWSTGAFYNVSAPAASRWCTYSSGDNTSVIFGSGETFTVYDSINNASVYYISKINNNWSITNVSVTVSASGYSTKTINLTNVTSNYTTTLNPITLIINVYNENTQQIINATTITGYIIGTNYNANFTITNGTIYLPLATADTYQLFLGGSGYSSRSYTIDYTGSSVITAYLQPTPYSGVVLYDVEQNYNAVPFYQNSLLRQNTTGSYFEVERCTGDSSGQCIVSAYPICSTNDTSCPFYRIIVYDPSGNIVGDTGALRFNSNQYTLVINPNNVLGTTNDYFGLSQFFTSWDTNLGIITYYFDNTNSQAQSVTVTVTRRVGSSRTVLETITSSSTGLIVITTTGFNVSLGDEFIASAVWYDQSGSPHQGAISPFSPPGSGLGSSKGGILPFLFLGIVLAPLLLFDLSPPLAVGGTAALLYVSNLIGLASLTTNVIGGIIVLGGVVLWLVFK